MVVQPSLLHELVKWVGLATSIVSASLGVYHFGQRVVDWVLEPRRTILKLATNHLPHIQDSLTQHTTALAAMQSDLRDLDTKVAGYSQRLDDTKDAVDKLSDAFIAHLEKMPHASGI